MGDGRKESLGVVDAGRNRKKLDRLREENESPSSSRFSSWKAELTG